MKIPSVVGKAIEVVNTDRWSGDHRVNMNQIIGAGRVLAKWIAELEQKVDNQETLRKEFAKVVPVPTSTSWELILEKVRDKFNETT